MTSASFGWTKILRLGLVQTMLGAIIVLMTSTINRVMVVELRVAGRRSWPFDRLALRHPDSAAGMGLWVGRRRAPDALDHRRWGGYSRCRS